MVRVELVYVARDGQIVQYKMDLKSGATVEYALNESNIYHAYPETREFVAGVYGKQVAQDKILKDGDRIELYRPLTADPKEKRRQLARLRK